MTCLLKAIVIHLSKEAKERDTAVVRAFTPVSLLCMRMSTPVFQSFGDLPEHQAT